MSKLFIADLEYSDELDTAALCTIVGGGLTITLHGTKKSDMPDAVKNDKSDNLLMQNIAGSATVELTLPAVSKKRKFNLPKEC